MLMFIVTLTQTQTQTNEDKKILFSFIHSFIQSLRHPCTAVKWALYAPFSIITFAYRFPEYSFQQFASRFGTHSFGLAFIKISVKRSEHIIHDWNEIEYECIVLSSPSENKSRVIISHFPFLNMWTCEYSNCVFCAVSTQKKQNRLKAHTKRIHLKWCMHEPIIRTYSSNGNYFTDLRVYQFGICACEKSDSRRKMAKYKMQ